MEGRGTICRLRISGRRKPHRRGQGNKAPIEEGGKWCIRICMCNTIVCAIVRHCYLSGRSTGILHKSHALRPLVLIILACSRTSLFGVPWHKLVTPSCGSLRICLDRQWTRPDSTIQNSPVGSPAFHQSLSSCLHRFPNVRH